MTRRVTGRRFIYPPLSSTTSSLDSAAIATSSSSTTATFTTTPRAQQEGGGEGSTNQIKDGRRKRFYSGWVEGEWRKEKKLFVCLTPNPQVKGHGWTIVGHLFEISECLNEFRLAKTNIFSLSCTPCTMYYVNKGGGRGTKTIYLLIWWFVV